MSDYPGQEFYHEHNLRIKYKEEKFMSEQKPSIGRIVHYVLDSGRHLPAIITDVQNNGKESSSVNLYIFWDANVPKRYDLERGAVECQYNDTGVQPQTWHWPERV